MRYLLLLLSVIITVPAKADQRAYGWCETGGQVVVTSGINSTTKVMRSYPQCTVTVYPAGSNTPVAGSLIYSDNGVTSKGNPFTSGTNGYWFFYAANGRYDVTISGGGLAAPFTFGDILLADPFSTAGAVYSIIAGNHINVDVPTGNVTVSSPAPYWTPYYNFSAQTPGGSLAIGNNSVTFIPVPRGVNGSDSGHYLRVSGGTGTAEVCLISGGAGTAGQTSGVVILNCAGTHTGAWQVASATAGVAEAVQAAATTGNGGTVELPAGVSAFYGPVFINGAGTRIIGQGISSSSVVNHNATLPSFHFLNGSGNEISYMTISGDTTGHGVIGIIVELQNSIRMHHLSVFALTCIQMLPTNFGVFLDHSSLSSYDTGATALFDNQSADDVFITNSIFSCNGTPPRQDGIRIDHASGFYINQLDVLTCQLGFHVNPTGAHEAVFMFINGGVFDTSIDGGILIEPQDTALAASIEFVNSWTASTSAGNGVTLRTFNTGVVNGVKFIGHRSYDNWLNGYSFTGTNVKNVVLENSNACGNSVASGGTAFGAEFASGVSNFQINGGMYGQCDAQVDRQGTPIAVTNAASDNYQIIGTNTLASAFASGIAAVGGTNRIIKDNLGVDNVIPAVASGAALAFPLNPNFTITGTTGVTSVTGLWAGKNGTFRTTDGAVVFTAGATIGTTITTSTNVLYSYVFDGTKIWIK